MTTMRLLRFVSISEGVSYLLLLLVAMPLKYLCDMPLAVKFVGWAHGVLFITLAISVLLAMLLAALPFKTACVVGIASLLPAGPFFADRLLRRHVDNLAASGIPCSGQAKKDLGGSDAAVADG
jgi:integral membrane protein